MKSVIHRLVVFVVDRALLVTYGVGLILHIYLFNLTPSFRLCDIGQVVAVQ